MATSKQIQASRANGAKSKGPVTPQGKRNSSRNSIRHGLLADTIVLEAEKRPAFLALVASLFEEHQPQTRTEVMMVDTIAVARWRQDRIWAMQKVAFDHDAASGDPAASAPFRAVFSLRSSPENVRTHELMLRYEVSFDRQISRTLNRLHQLQQKRLSPPPPASAPAIRTRQPIERIIETVSATPKITSPPKPPQPSPSRESRPTIVKSPAEERESEKTRLPAPPAARIR